MSRRMLTLVDVALDAARRSDGAVDPTVGAHVLRAGYADDISLVRGRLVLPGAQDVPPADWRRLRVDRTLTRVGVPAGHRLDLGATAKAWTADTAARTIAAGLGTAVLVEIGGDVSVAGHRRTPWHVQVSEQAGGPGTPVGLVRGGLATSSTTSRRWRTPAGEAHHVIDPRTGRPATGPWRTVTAWADSAVLANTASTAALVVGEDAPDLLAELRVAARLVAADGTVTTVGAWPSQARAA